MQALLPTCAAVIHGAGVGTAHDRRLYGVPHTALPWDAEQPLLSGRLAAYGGGLTTHATRATGDIVRDHPRHVFKDDEFGHRPSRLRQETLGVPHPADLVAELVNRISAMRR